MVDSRHGIRPRAVSTSVLALLFLVATAHGQGDDAAREKVRRIYAVWQEGIGDQPPPAPKDATSRLRDIYAGAPTAASVNRAVFAREFAKLPFDGWHPVSDAQLVSDGLRLAAQSAYLDGMPEAAVEAGTLFLARHGEHAEAPVIRGLHRPAALTVAGRYDEAAAQLAKHAGELKWTPAARAWTLHGDLAAARGRFEEAAAHYLGAYEGTWEKGEFDLESLPRELRLRVWAGNHYAKERLAVRERLVGKPLPKFRKLEGIGPVADALARKPRVIVLFFFSPSNDDNFRTLLELDRIALRAGPERMSVLGVTWYESLTEGSDGRWMRMPKSRDELRGEALDVEPRKFRAALTELHKRLELSFPLATVKPAHAHEWTGRASELLVATDAERRVAYATTVLKSTENAALELALVRAVLASQPK